MVVSSALLETEDFCQVSLMLLDLERAALLAAPNEPLSKLLVSPLVTPIVVPYIIPYRFPL